MKSIAFYNNKGGVAKTTSVINVGYELARENRVLIIDADGQANCSRFFTEELKSGLETALTDGTGNPARAVCETRYENIDIITATAALNDATAAFTAFDKRKQERIARNIIEYGKEYDYVLLDLPPALTQVTECLVGACDFVFVPIELGTFAIQGIPTITELINKGGKPSAFGGCFVTKFDKKNSADIALLELIKDIDGIGNKVIDVTIPFSRVIKNSISGKKTASEYMPWTTPAKSYGELTKAILERVCE